MALLIVEESQDEINRLKKTLITWFKITNLGPVTYYLGYWITRYLIAGTKSLTQETYIKKILASWGMQNAKEVNTPMTKNDILVNTDPSYQADSSTMTWYQKSIGSFIYAMTETQFDIEFAVSIVNLQITQHRRTLQQ